MTKTVVVCVCRCRSASFAEYWTMHSCCLCVDLFVCFFVVLGNVLVSCLVVVCCLLFLVMCLLLVVVCCLL